MACEKDKCKVEKCVEIWAPSEYFPDYTLEHTKQCEQIAIVNPDTYKLSVCSHVVTDSMKFDFKKRNEYAKPLTNAKRKLMQYRVTEIGLALLFFNFLLTVICVVSGKYYKRFDSGSVKGGMIKE